MISPWKVWSVHEIRFLLQRVYEYRHLHYAAENRIRQFRGLNGLAPDCRIDAEMRREESGQKKESLLQLRDAAVQLGISFPTIKQWIYKKKIRSVKTAGGHHRIPQGEVDRLLFRTREKAEIGVIRRVSGRNQLVGRIEAVRISGLMAEVEISIGGQKITSIITSRSAREMQLKAGQTAAALIKATEVMILRV